MAAAIMAAMAAPSLFQSRLISRGNSHLRLLPHMISPVVPRCQFTTLRASASDDRVEPVPKSYSVAEELEEVYGESEIPRDPLYLVDEMSSADSEASHKQTSDIMKAVSVGALAVAATAIVQQSWVSENQSLTMSVVFGLGYLGIIFEEMLAFDKAGVGLLMAAALWVIRSIGAPSADTAAAELTHSCGEASEIVFFLLGAMTIVEIVDAHQGFKIVTDSISTRKPRLLLWVIGWISFFLSSVLDNLTSTIVMISLLRKLVKDPDQRRYLGAVVVLAANAGGAWSPIGDVTTTMLWINGHISSVRTLQDLFIPSAISLAVPLALMSMSRDSEGKQVQDLSPKVVPSEQMAPRGHLVFAVGIGALTFVPVFKSLTGLPPFLGMLLGLGTLWLCTDAIHSGETGRHQLRVPQALSRIDTQGVLFFLGILLSVGSLQAAGILQDLAEYLNAHIPSVELIAGAIGLVSALIDNVPLVAATMGMYPADQFPMDSELWQLIAFCAGTGGSILIIGSAAGVAFMGMEKAGFLWYLKKVSGYAMAGYVAGMGAYIAALQFHSPSLPGINVH